MLGRRVITYKNINLLLAVAALTCCAFLSIRAKAYIDNDIFYIAPIINGSNNSLKIDSVKDLDFDALVSYELYEKAVIRFNKNQTYGNIFFTNTEYFSMNNIKFADGGVWAKDVEGFAVINEALAFKIFGSINATGAELIISEKCYLVSGVVKQEMASSEQYTAWIPFSLKGAEDKIASALFIKPAVYNPIGSTKHIEKWLGVSSSSYYICDLNMYKESMALRYKTLLLLMCGCMAIYVTHKLYILFGAVRWKFLCISAIMNLLLAAAIWFSLDINIWIPKFSGTEMYQILQAIFNWKRLPSSEYLTASVLNLSILNAYSNIAFGVGVLGMVNFIFIKE